MSEQKKLSDKYEIDFAKFCKLAAQLAEGGFGEGHANAIDKVKMCVYRVEGDERIPITDEEAAMLIKHGYTQ